MSVEERAHRVLRPVWADPARFASPPVVEKRPKQPSGETSFGRSDPSLPSYVEIGNHTYYLPSETRFLGWVPSEKIIIGKYCSIAREVTILVGGNHTTETVSTYPFDGLLLGRTNPNRSYKMSRNTEIGSDVWLGYGAHIAGGVHIGHGAVVASRAAVFGDVPPYGVVVGNPARLTRYRFSESIVESLLRIAWWNWPDEVVRRNVEWFYRPVGEFVKQFDPAGGLAS